MIVKTTCASCGAENEVEVTVATVGIGVSLIEEVNYAESVCCQIQPPRFFRVVNTDNFGGDYPDEWFVGPEYATKVEAQEVADIMNHDGGDLAPRFHKVVELPYELRPGFEP